MGGGRCRDALLLPQQATDARRRNEEGVYRPEESRIRRDHGARPNEACKPRQRRAMMRIPRGVLPLITVAAIAVAICANSPPQTARPRPHRIGASPAPGKIRIAGSFSAWATKDASRSIGIRLRRIERRPRVGSPDEWACVVDDGTSAFITEQGLLSVTVRVTSWPSTGCRGVVASTWKREPGR